MHSHYLPSLTLYFALAPTVGVITQLRVFGGVVGVVIGRVAQSTYLARHLPHLLMPGELDATLSAIGTISSLPPQTAAAVREVYGESFNWQFRILTFIAAANVVVALFTFRRRPVTIEEAQARETAELEARRREEGDEVEMTAGAKDVEANDAGAKGASSRA